jgi:hypothetical protein
MRDEKVTDDRLLDLALGLRKDDELLSQVRRSRVLRRRLQELRADVDGAEREFGAILMLERRGVRGGPRESREGPPGDRPVQSRSTEEDGARRPRARVRLRMVVPALVFFVVLGTVAAALGITARPGRPLSTSGDSATTSGGGEISPSELRRAAAGDAGLFRQVTVVRAGRKKGLSQVFSVVRTLKGIRYRRVAVTLASNGKLSPSGSLYVLLAAPVSGLTMPAARGVPVFAAARSKLLPLPAGTSPDSLPPLRAPSP